MRHKRRRGVNPLREYRRLQREIRDLYDPFTARHCPGCAAPCCVKPTRVTPVDVALALGLGHSFPHLGDQDPYGPALEYAGHRLAPAALPLPMAPAEEAVAYCDYLDRGRCTFPDETLRRLRRLLRQLEDAHTDLLRALRDSGRLPETEA